MYRTRMYYVCYIFVPKKRACLPLEEVPSSCYIMQYYLIYRHYLLSDLPNGL
jgi:hypothetical protein